MRTTRVYCPQTLSSGQQIAAPSDSAHHLANVLRLKVGACLQLFNRQDGEFACTIASVKKGDVVLDIEDRLRSYEPPRLAITLCLGVSRGDRMDFAIQKSTELGVQRITPFYSEHGDVRLKPAERLQKKMSHWQRVAISAAEQSGRLDVPEIAEPLDLDACLQATADSPVLLFDPSGTATLQEAKIGAAVTVVVGPEGGFAAAELASARQRDCRLVALGPRILRTETAPLAALSILQYCFGDLGSGL